MGYHAGYVALTLSDDVISIVFRGVIIEPFVYMIYLCYLMLGYVRVFVCYIIYAVLL